MRVNFHDFVQVGLWNSVFGHGNEPVKRSGISAINARPGSPYISVQSEPSLADAAAVFRPSRDYEAMKTQLLGQDPGALATAQLTKERLANEASRRLQESKSYAMVKMHEAEHTSNMEKLASIKLLSLAAGAETRISSANSQEMAIRASMQASKNAPTSSGK